MLESFFTGCVKVEKQFPGDQVDVAHIRPDLSYRHPDCDDEEDELLARKPLLDTDSYVTDLGDVPGVVAAFPLDKAPAFGAGGHLEALATPPLAFRTILPEDHVAGQSIKVTGPLGTVQVTPPSDVQPGTPVTFRLAPPTRFKVQVPPGMQAGDFIKYRTSEGDMVEIGIPEGMTVGENFDVSPPSLMVKVPEGAMPGDTTVVFRTEEGAWSNRWLYATVPASRKPGDYFAARLPIPLQLPPPSDHVAETLTSWFGNWGMSGM